MHEKLQIDHSRFREDSDVLQQDEQKSWAKQGDNQDKLVAFSERCVLAFVQVWSLDSKTLVFDKMDLEIMEELLPLIKDQKAEKIHSN